MKPGKLFGYPIRNTPKLLIIKNNKELPKVAGNSLENLFSFGIKEPNNKNTG